MQKSTVVFIVVFVIGLVLGVGVSHILYQNPPSNDTSSLGESTKLRGVITDNGDNTTLHYANTQFKFLLDYPNDLAVHEFDETGGSKTIVFQKQGEETGFQIFITPYSDSTIDESRIKKDIPSGIVRDPKEIILADGIHALLFWSEASIIGESREVWFIKNGYLYEVTTYAKLDTWLGEILKSLSFES